MGNGRILIWALSLISLSIHPELKQPNQKKGLIYLDGIEATVRGSEGTYLILSSELQRFKLDGTPNTLDEMITNHALFNEAKKYRLLSTPEEIDKQWRMMAEANKKTPKELDDMVIMAGFTPQEARNEFGQMNAINSLVSFKVTANLIVPESDVIAYYNEHPEVEPAAYNIQYVFVPFSFKSKEDQKKQLQVIARKNDPQHLLNWQDPFWVAENELAVDKQFITLLGQGQISEPVEVSGGFELIKLIQKREERVKPLDECYSQIANILRKPKYLELMNSFQKGVRDSVVVTHFTVPK